MSLVMLAVTAHQGRKKTNCGQFGHHSSNGKALSSASNHSHVTTICNLKYRMNDTTFAQQVTSQQVSLEKFILLKPLFFDPLILEVFLQAIFGFKKNAKIRGFLKIIQFSKFVNFFQKIHLNSQLFNVNSSDDQPPVPRIRKLTWLTLDAGRGWLFDL